MQDDIREILAGAKNPGMDQARIETFKKEADDTLKKTNFYIYREILQEYQNNCVTSNYDDLKKTLIFYTPEKAVNELFHKDFARIAQKLSNNKDTYYFIKEYLHNDLKPINLKTLINLTIEYGYDIYYNLDDNFIFYVTFSISRKNLEKLIDKYSIGKER